MSAKINTSTIEQGIVDIITWSNDIDKNNLKDDIRLDFTNQNIEYIIYVYDYENRESAEKGFDFYIKNTDLDETKEKENIRYAFTKCFRPRDWRYFGAAEQCHGSVFVLYENYVVEINYYYIRNRIEVYFSALCHPESIYREEIDLSEVSTGRDQSGDGRGK